MVTAQKLEAALSQETINYLPIFSAYFVVLVRWLREGLHQTRAVGLAVGLLYTSVRVEDFSHSLSQEKQIV